MNSVYTESVEKFNESEWLAAVEAIAGEVHEVDRVAVQIWFRFNPLDLVRYLESADDLQKALQGIALQGDFGIVDKVDTSHRFMYGHRYWPVVKSIVQQRAESGEAVTDLAAEIKAIANTAAAEAKTKESLTLGIAAVGLMTLVQAGYEDFKKAPGIAASPSGLMSKSPDSIVAERAKDDSQGIFGFLKSIDKKFSVDFTSFASEGSFPVINEEELVTASQKDRSHDWQSLDERCWEGPIPIECTSASCGTCWIGVTGGAEKLNEPSERERKQMKVFGYNQPEDAKPFMRLACQAKATGNVSIVIPPWNAVFGKKVRNNVEDVELEPNTTSAKRLRETIASAMNGDN